MPTLFNFSNPFARRSRSPSLASRSTCDAKTDYYEGSHETSSAPPPYSEDISDEPVPGRSRSKKRSLNYFRQPLRKNSMENALEMLKDYNIIFLVDDSGSMWNKWDEVKVALADIAEIANAYDDDGVDIHFLNETSLNKNMHLNLKDGYQVQNLFSYVSPKGPTPLGDRLDTLLLDYINEIEEAKAISAEELKKIKKANFIVITDGEPSDDPKPPIIEAATRLSQGRFPLSQVGIQFVQIGNSSAATRFLKELDDDLSKERSVRDIVDTTPYLGQKLTRDMLIKIMLGGVNRKFDAKAN